MGKKVGVTWNTVTRKMGKKVCYLEPLYGGLPCVVDESIDENRLIVQSNYCGKKLGVVSSLVKRSVI